MLGAGRFAESSGLFDIVRSNEVAPARHCEEPFDAACGGAQDKLPLRGSDEAIQGADALRWIASLRSQ
jgi:hypothetical protein